MTDLLAELRIQAWERQRLALQQGEVPAPDQFVAPPRIRPGVTVRSASMSRETAVRAEGDPVDGDSPTFIGKGGIVWARADNGTGWECVDIWNGLVYRWRVDDDDIDWETYTGVINTRAVEGLRRRIGQEIARPRDVGRQDPHRGSRLLSALAVLTAIIENPELASNSDAATDPSR